MNFRAEAIQAIGRIVNARSWCLRNNRGKYLPASVTTPVINQYRAHKASWTTRGVALFIIKYESNLRRMATGGYQQQQLISKLILEAYHYERTTNIIQHANGTGNTCRTKNTNPKNLQTSKLEFF